MDVISAVASFIAIGQALAAIPKIIDALASIVEARQELLQLVNDVELLNALGVLIRETTDNLDNDYKTKLRIPQHNLLLIERVRVNIESIVPQLEELARKCQKQSGNGNERIKPVSRLKWFQHKKHIVSLSERARKYYIDLQTILSLNSLFTSTAHGKMIIDIHTVVMNQAHSQGPQLSPLQPPSQLRYIGEVLSHAIDTSTKHDVSESVDTDLDGSGESSLQSVAGEPLPQPYPTERVIQEPLMYLRATLPRGCTRGCLCQCHSPPYQTRPNPAVSPIYGWLKSAYNIVPRTNARRCDIPTCRRAHLPAYVNIRLPLLFCSRILEATMSFSSIAGVGASLHLHVACVIPASAGIWWEIELNKVDMVLSRLSRREVSPIDIIDGDSDISILEVAANRAKYQIVEFLVREMVTILRGTDVAKRLARRARHKLHFSVVSENEEKLFQMLTALDEDIDSRRLPLHEAIEEGNDLTLILKDSSEDINTLDSFGIAPLHYAVRNNDVSAIQHLLSYGANPNISNQFGDSPLMEAATRGHHDCIQTLINCGCDINFRSEINGQTAIGALFESRHEGSTEMARLLLKNGANINVHGGHSRGELLLHTLARSNHAAELVEKFQLLIHAGLEIDQETSYGRTPLEVAFLFNNTAMVHLLIGAGCKPKDTPCYGNVLGGIAYHYCAEIIDIIDEAKLTMDVRWRNYNGDTPLDVFEWRMDTALLPADFQTPSDDDVEAFRRLLVNIRDRYLNIEIRTLETIVTHLEEHECALAREALHQVIEEKIKWNIPAEYRTFRAIDVQIKEEMIEAAIESLEEFMEVSRSHIGTDPFDDDYCRRRSLEGQELVVQNLD